MIRFSVAVFTVFLVVSLVLAKPPQSFIAVKTLGCKCGPNCSCAAGECGDPGCPTAQTKSPGPIEEALYRIQYAKAISQNKPLLIWVGETCPVCEASWPEFVHARLSEYDGPSGVYQGPGVVIGKPDGFGGLTRVGTLPGIPSKAAVEALTAPTPAPVRRQASFAPPPMMFGGFGGGSC